jgi:hypothetical protein
VWQFLPPCADGGEGRSYPAHGRLQRTGRFKPLDRATLARSAGVAPRSVADVGGQDAAPCLRASPVRPDADHEQHATGALTSA